jgi:hypothetical protein
MQNQRLDARLDPFQIGARGALLAAELVAPYRHVGAAVKWAEAAAIDDCPHVIFGIDLKVTLAERSQIRYTPR